MTWIFCEFYHLKTTKRVYSCIHTKSKAQQSCAATVIFAGVLTVLPNITLEGCITRPLILSSVLLTSALTWKTSAPTPRWRLCWLQLLMVTTLSQSSSSKTREEARLGSPNNLLTACCKSCYQSCWRLPALPRAPHFSFARFARACPLFALLIESLEQAIAAQPC